ncbi:unnamed protein product [Brassica oleracea var. botrytis]
MFKIYLRYGETHSNNRHLLPTLLRATTTTTTILLTSSTASNSYGSKRPREKLLGGLLATEFDEESCLSRYDQPSLRKPSPHKPSAYLVSKLRSFTSAAVQAQMLTRVQQRSLALSLGMKVNLLVNADTSFGFHSLGLQTE